MISFQPSEWTDPSEVINFLCTFKMDANGSKHTNENDRSNQDPLLGFSNSIYSPQIKENKDYNNEKGEEEVNADIKHGTWRAAMYDWCQNTTLHGLKQVTEPQPFILRR